MASRYIGKVSSVSPQGSVTLAKDRAAIKESVAVVDTAPYVSLVNLLDELLNRSRERNMHLGGCVLADILGSTRNISAEAAAKMVADLVRKEYPNPPVEKFKKAIQTRMKKMELMDQVCGDGS